ncbi:hypothetical protein OG455_27655 [Kitasatospora sp. NBC_01287]|uniref:hypothetical protein n=1 Tax=Kitasatospora sp. NBC_01287 TaxID=2903573 RepID=UPI00224E023D|nr:hypothetical protein [Kitasatospora sp. NBC_01287]MCX4749237.1 hypothetical protein [Kitasatospora sp. NBC_01287]
MTTTTTITSPPAAAVAKDAHWRAKMARLRAHSLPERTVRICDDDAAKLAVTDAQLKLAKARAEARTSGSGNGVDDGNGDAFVEAHPKVVIARSFLANAEQDLTDATVELTFRALPRPAWEALLREHAPTEEQADNGMDYDVERFPAALIAASHVERDPSGTEVDGMTVADAQTLLDEWSDSDAKVLFTGAMLVNQQMRADLGKG